MVSKITILQQVIGTSFGARVDGRIIYTGIQLLLCFESCDGGRNIIAIRWI